MILLTKGISLSNPVFPFSTLPYRQHYHYHYHNHQENKTIIFSATVYTAIIAQSLHYTLVLKVYDFVPLSASDFRLTCILRLTNSVQSCVSFECHCDKVLQDLPLLHEVAFGSGDEQKLQKRFWLCSFLGGGRVEGFSFSFLIIFPFNSWRSMVDIYV